MGQKSTQTNKYDWMHVPQTADYQAFKDFKIQDDPSLPYRFAGQRRDFLNTFQNPYGAYTTPELREQMTRAGLEEIGQAEGQAFREGQYDKNQLELGKLGALMAYSKPELVQTQGTAKQGMNWGGLLGGLATAGLGFI